MKNILPIKAIVLGLTVSMTLFGMVGCGEDTEATDTTEETAGENTDATETTDETVEETTEETTDETSEETTEETTDETAEETTEDTTEETTDETTEETSTEVSEFWGAFCTADAECGAPTDYCVKQPGESEGYCSIKCSANSVCYDAGADQETWSCNAVFGQCSTPDFTWCGPKEEVGVGPIEECL